MGGVCSGKRVGYDSGAQHWQSRAWLCGRHAHVARVLSMEADCRRQSRLGRSPFRSLPACNLVVLIVILVLPACDVQRERTIAPVKIIGSPGSAAGQFVEPRAIAASPDGKLFVVDKTGRVQRFDAHGRFEHSWTMPDDNPDQRKPSGICVDSKGRVFVADTHRHRVVVFDQQGNELQRFGEYGRGPGQFIFPTDVVVDLRGFIYVSEYGGNDRISKFGPDGKFLFSFGGLEDGFGALQRPSGLAIDQQNNLWVADASNHRVCCFDDQGRYLKRIGRLGSGPERLRYPRDVAITSNGDLLVADSGNDRIVQFDGEGHYVGSLGAGGRGLGNLNVPLNLAVGRSHLAVADSKNSRIVLWISSCLPSFHESEPAPATGLLAKEIRP